MDTGLCGSPMNFYQVPGLSWCSHLRPRAYKWGQIPTGRPSHTTAKMPAKDVPHLVWRHQGKHITVTWGYSRVPLPSQAYLGPHSHKNPTTKNHPIWILSFPVFLNDVCLYCPRTLCWHSSSLEIGRFHPIDFWLLSILPRYHLMVLFFASNGVLFSGYRFKFLGLPSF